MSARADLRGVDTWWDVAGADGRTPDVGGPLTFAEMTEAADGI